MSILSGNLAEGTVAETQPQQPTPPTVKSVESKPIQLINHGSLLTDILETSASVTQRPEERVHIFLKFNFTMESFIIDLYTGSKNSVIYFNYKQTKNLFIY